MANRNRATDVADIERRPTTAHDVARLAGVSQSAVSRTFTPGASVSAETRVKVMAAAEQLGYRPNLIARSLITRRSNVIGVAVPGTDNPFYAAALDALSVAFGRIGYRVLLFTVDPIATPDLILEEVLRYRVDALVLISTSLSSKLADECVQIGLPVVMFNRKSDSDAAFSVTGDNLHGARVIAAFLMAGGHRRYAYVAGLDHSSTSRDREEGFFGYLAARKITHVERRTGNYSTAGATAAVRSLLASKAPPDAIFCASDHMAIVALNIARFEFGLVPGQDISIVGFDNIDMAAWPSFGLTTYSQPVGAMVNQAVSIIQRQLSGVAPIELHQTTPGELFVRTSARKPRSGLTQIGSDWVWRPRAGSRIA